MKAFLKMTTAAAALAGAALASAPASAQYVGVGVGPIGFDVYSGGYCDRWGCPTDYWNYPIYYGPVYYDNVWYRGPVYTRVVDGERWYWIHGAWHNDQWRGPRPSWAHSGRYGEPLGLDYYREHGFRVSDRDWHAWQDRDDRYRTGYRDYDQGAYGHENRSSDQYRDYERGRDYDRDRTNDRDMDQDRNGPDYDRNRGTYQHSGYDRDQYRDRDTYNASGYDHDQYSGHDGQNGADYDRDRGYERTNTYDRDRDTSYDKGYQHTGYDQDREKYGQTRYEHTGYDRDHGSYHADYEHSGGASGSGHMTYSKHHAYHPHHTHHTSASSHHVTMQPSGRDENSGYQHTRYDQERTHSSLDRVRSDRDGNSGMTDQDRDRDRPSGTENNYERTNYQPASERGHAKAPPPKASHHSSQQQNPDQENNGPSE